MLTEVTLLRKMLKQIYSVGRWWFILLFLAKSYELDKLRLEPNFIEAEVEGSKDLLREAFSSYAADNIDEEINDLIFAVLKKSCFCT